MATTTDPEVEGLLLVSPAYSAVRVWLPRARELALKVATPPFRALLPTVVPPSLKVTVPVGLVPVTVAVSVTLWPTGAVPLLLDNAVVLGPARAMAGATRMSSTRRLSHLVKALVGLGLLLILLPPA